VELTVLAHLVLNTAFCSSVPGSSGIREIFLALFATDNKGIDGKVKDPGTEPVRPGELSPPHCVTREYIRQAQVVGPQRTNTGWASARSQSFAAAVRRRIHLPPLASDATLTRSDECAGHQGQREGKRICVGAGQFLSYFIIS